jgi:hypothetical protein
VTETDRGLSAKYFEEAASSGDPLAIGNLAFFHLDGKVCRTACEHRTKVPCNTQHSTCISEAASPLSLNRRKEYPPHNMWAFLHNCK